MTTKRAFVLLSGGIDSTTCLHKAILDFQPKNGLEENTLKMFQGLRGPPHPNGVDWVEAISVDYGQRHKKETEYAAATCAKFGIKHSVLNIRGILDGAGVMLTDAAEAIPSISYDEIKGVSPTYVPFRNGTLLSLITAHAQKWVNEQIKMEADQQLAGFVQQDVVQFKLNAGAELADMPNYKDMQTKAQQCATNLMRDSAGIYFGAHAEDAANWAYPDCTPEFIGAMANAIYVGSYGCIRLYTPIQWSDKEAVIRLGQSLGVDWRGTWSCYAGGEKHCGTCPTCRARMAGFKAAGVPDPTEYRAAGEI